MYYNNNTKLIMTAAESFNWTGHTFAKRKIWDRTPFLLPTCFFSSNGQSNVIRQHKMLVQVQQEAINLKDVITMQRITYVIVSAILVVLCITYSLNTNKDRSECNQETITSSEESIDADSQMITSSIQESSQEELISSKPKESFSSTTTSKKPTAQSYTAPNSGGKFKSYTNYRLLNKSSPQWNKIQCHGDSYTDKNGLRKLGEYYCVAMGSYYTKTLGDLFEIKTEGGSFKAIICDFKADAHTDVKNQYTLSNGCMAEFYVDMSSLNEKARQMGDISYVDDKFSGRIISITKIGNYFDIKESESNESKN